jgi:SAM-dependent methyltransferase
VPSDRIREVPSGEIVWQMGEIPFFLQCFDSPTNAPFGLPDVLPFTLECDPKDGVIRQQRNRTVEMALEMGYKRGSEISGVMDDVGIGQSYAKDFIRYIDEIEPSLQGKRILEIGCGKGYLLSLLKARGADVLGIEPGPHGQEGGKRFEVPVTQGFFPSCLKETGFDFIVAYAVLEHLLHPEEFLASVMKNLSPDGRVILAVPDCSPYLSTGDISCLLHEHWSYFCHDSLDRLMRRCGLLPQIRGATFGGILYCTATPHDFSAQEPALSDERHSLSHYRHHAQVAMERLREFFQMLRTESADNSIGVYVPGRFLNMLSLLGEDAAGLSLRFFDDNDALHGKFYPTFPILIEGFTDFARKPTDWVIVTSNTFGASIASKLRETAPSTRIATWGDFFL